MEGCNSVPSSRAARTPISGDDSFLPRDSVLLPLFEGRLVVSPGHAVFCRIPESAVDQLERVLCGGLSSADLPSDLRAELTRHGFGEPPRPQKPPNPSVQLQLTNACNLSCSYCCTNSGLARSAELNRERLFAVVDDVARILGAGTRLGMLGGEPFLVPWAIDLAEHALDRDLQLTVFTNGTMIDDDLAGRIAALIERGAQVRISLASATRPSCDNISGAERFDRALEGMHAVARHRVLPIVDLMLLPDQVDFVAEHMVELRKLLPEGARIALGILYLSGREKGDNLFSSRAELEDALDRITFEAGETIAATQPSPVADRREGCTCALGHHLHVRSDGALFTCFKMEEKVGDLAKISFGEALEAVQASARPATVLPFCAECPLATLCGGGCRTENLQYTGDADEPICGPWRVRVLCELLGEDRAAALEWPATHLLAEARARGIEGPEMLLPVVPSRHLIDT